MIRRKTVVVVGVALAMAAAMTPAPAHARPPGFPDLGSFTPIVDTTGFTFSWRGGSELSFTTPDGSIGCLFNAVASCNGAISALPPTASSGRAGGCPYVSHPDVDVHAAAPYRFTTTGGTCPPFLGRPLPTGHKISTSAMTCAVGQDSLVACVDADDQHGFVLSHTGSWTF